MLHAITQAPFQFFPWIRVAACPKQKSEGRGRGTRVIGCRCSDARGAKTNRKMKRANRKQQSVLQEQDEERETEQQDRTYQLNPQISCVGAPHATRRFVFVRSSNCAIVDSSARARALVRLKLPSPFTSPTALFSPVSISRSRRSLVAATADEVGVGMRDPGHVRFCLSEVFAVPSKNQCLLLSRQSGFSAVAKDRTLSPGR